MHSSTASAGQRKLHRLISTLQSRFCPGSLALVQVWASCIGTTWKGISKAQLDSVVMHTPDQPYSMEDAALQDFRTNSYQQGITGSALGMIGKVWSSGALQVVQNVAIIPRTVHPRNKLEASASKLIAELVYIPIYDLTAPASGVVAILEVIVSASAVETMIVAAVISNVSTILEELQLSLSKPDDAVKPALPQPEVAPSCGAQAAAHSQLSPQQQRNMVLQMTLHQQGQLEEQLIAELHGEASTVPQELLASAQGQLRAPRQLAAVAELPGGGLNPAPPGFVASPGCVAGACGLTGPGFPLATQSLPNHFNRQAFLKSVQSGAEAACRGQMLPPPAANRAYGSNILNGTLLPAFGELPLERRRQSLDASAMQLDAPQPQNPFMRRRSPLGAVASVPGAVRGEWAAKQQAVAEAMLRSPFDKAGPWSRGSSPESRSRPESPTGGTSHSSCDTQMAFAPHPAQGAAPALSRASSISRTASIRHLDGLADTCMRDVSVRSHSWDP